MVPGVTKLSIGAYFCIPWTKACKRELFSIAMVWIISARTSSAAGLTANPKRDASDAVKTAPQNSFKDNLRSQQ